LLDGPSARVVNLMMGEEDIRDLTIDSEDDRDLVKTVEMDQPRHEHDLEDGFTRSW
jgi:hypothetical protein